MEENFSSKNSEGTPFAHNEAVDRKQSSEEIIFILEQATTNQEKVRITVRSMNGEYSKKMHVISWTLEGDILWIVTEAGDGMPIELSRIEKVEQKKEEKPSFEEVEK